MYFIIIRQLQKMAAYVATNKFIGKQVIAAQTLNTPLYNRQNKKIIFSAQFVALYASNKHPKSHQQIFNNVRLACAVYFRLRSFKFFSVTAIVTK